MAAHSNRSPSPLSSRPINPNPRNSETNIPSIRRSFNGNNTFARPSALTNQRRLDPNTPANSPSDFGRRRSVGKEGTAPPHLKACEEKENDENDSVLKASKLQSPAKGCKNFMAPTISAASKFTPSPRKKVLVERNEPVRTSISLSDGKAMFFSAVTDVSQELEPKSEMGHHQNQKDETFSDVENKKAVLDSHPVLRPPCKKVTFSDIPSDSQPPSESVITDSESKVVPTSIAPLDADPSLPPYDPKTNYLSPRPQFIRYKPNPRVEMLLNKEKAFDANEFDNTLMAEMMSEGFSDSDEATDESQTQDSDMVIGVDEEIVVEAPASELSLPVSTTPVAEICEEGFVEKNEKKPRRWFRLMCFSVIMILLVCVSVRGAPPSPSFDEMFVKDLSLSDLKNLYEQSRVAVASARLSFGNSVSLVFKLANELVEGEKRVPLQFMNISDLQVEDTWKKDAYFLKRVEEEELDPEMEQDEFEEEEGGGAYADEEVVDTFFEEEEAEFAEGDYDDDFPQDDVVAAEETCAEVAAADLESEYSPDIQIQTEIASSIQSSAAIEVVATETEKSQADIILGASDDGAAAAISLDERSLDNTAMTESEESISALHAVAISSSLFAGVVGVGAFIYYLYKRNDHPTGSTVEPVMMSKQAEDGVTKTNKAAMTEQEREVSESCWETESEMSSSYHQIERSGNDEVESSERKTRRRKYSKRESLASSSPSSYSYGSFTTYERIPVKINNGYGDEEIVTPVRRSSRIRNMVTSP